MNPDEMLYEELTKEEKLGVSAFMLILTPFLLLWEGFILEKLWGWFAVPLGAVDISVVHAAGIVLLVGAVTMQFNDAVFRYPKKYLAYAIFSPAIVWLLGYFTQLFM